MAKGMTPARRAMELRKRVRQGLHDQLDALLNGTTDDNGQEISTIDSMVLRALHGVHFNVRVHGLHPSETDKVEAAGTVTPGARLGLLRDEPPAPPHPPEPEEPTDVGPIDPPA